MHATQEARSLLMSRTNLSRTDLEIRRIEAGTWEHQGTGAGNCRFGREIPAPVSTSFLNCSLALLSISLVATSVGQLVLLSAF
jgi:hypothetical protein